MKKRTDIQTYAGPTASGRHTAVIYARVSSKDQEKEGYSIPAQLELLRGYAGAHGFDVLKKFADVETAKAAGRTSFGEMIALLQKTKSCRTVLVEKTDRLYRNLKDWVTIEDLGLEIHFVKENVILAPDSRSSEKFMHGIKVLMRRTTSTTSRRKPERECWKRRAKGSGHRSRRSATSTWAERTGSGPSCPIRIWRRSSPGCSSTMSRASSR
jgi:DNA invertase Pin-like site-specific DNA recombinase